MSRFSKLKNVLKRSAATLLTAAMLATCVDASVVSVSAASGVLSDEDRGVIFASTRTDFRDESIYFVMTTRFYDGDSSNNTWCWDGGEKLNPGDPEWRGDFKGLIEKLDYIKALGFTAIWITPVVENCSGYDYHGYHAINHSKVDPRYESDDCTYQDLINACHEKDMKIIQDIVLNHTGNFGEVNLKPMFVKEGDLNTTDCLKKAESSVLPANYDSLLPTAQYDARIAAMKDDDKDTDNIYHHEKSLNWDDYTCQTAQIAGDCVDLNTENPVVYNYLVDCYTNYINMGVDAFRIDTVKHISRLTFNKVFNDAFINAAKANGKDFYMFGEVCTRDRNVWYRGTPPLSAPFYTWKESKEYAWSDTDYSVNLASTAQNYADNSDPNAEPTSDNAFLKGNEYHTPDYSKASGLNVIDFPMHWNFEDARSAFGVRGGDQYYNDATWNVTYVDSHDYAPDQAPENQRFARSQETWAENLSLMFTWRGIPCIYYGSEIEFKKGCMIDVGPNAALEDTGRAYYGDHIEGTITAKDFTVFGNVSGAVAETLNYPLAQHIMRLNRLRQAIPALRKGQYSTEGVSGDLAFKRRYTDGSTDSFVCVAISGSATFTGIPDGTYVDAVTGDTKTVSGGTLSISLSGQGNVRCYVLNTSKTSAPGRVITNGTYLTDGGAAELIGPVPFEIIEDTGVTLSDKSVTVLEGESATVKATVTPSNATYKTVTWTSDNPSVATVSGGKITGVSIGTATITAKTKSGKTATCKVTVKENTNIVKPTGITLDQTSLSLSEGGSATLTATVAPANTTNKTVTWTSDNPSVATVSGGKVTAVSQGSAVITASTFNGKTASATVNVTGKTYPKVTKGIYFEKPSGWGSNINAYIFDKTTDTTIGTAWPGTAMTLDSASGIYTLEVPNGTSNYQIVFNDGGNQAPSVGGYEFVDHGLYTSAGFSKVISEQENIDVTSVTLNKTSATINAGETTSFTATVAPANATNKAISWTSSNTSVATVSSSGVVTGVSKGTTTITAKSNNGKTATATVTVNTVTTELKNTSTISATSITLGDSLTLKGAATGGTSPYTYAVYYKQTSQTEWTAVQGYVSTISKTVTPKAATTYTVRVKAKDSSGTIVNKDFTVKVTKPATLTNNSTISATSIALGKSLTLKGAATGGTSPYTYAVFYKKASSDTWTTVQSYASSITKTITPLNATTYTVRVKVKDSAGTIANKDFTVKVTAALTNTSTISATSIALGNSLTLKGAATGGTSPYTYAVYYKQTSQTSWTTVQGTYASTITKTITPKAATTYTVRVKAKDKNGTIANKDFTVTVTKPLTNTSTISATSITLGKSLTLKGAATGGTSPYTYAVYYKQASQTSWTTVQGTYASTITKTVTPKAATTYTIRVKAKDKNGTIANKDFTVKVTNALANTSTISATAINLGDSLTLKGAATGGTGSYKYAVYYKKTSSTTWTNVQDYASSITKKVTPLNATTYTVRVKAKDSAGTVVNKDFTVKVTKALINDSTISATTISLGDSIVVTGAAEGGTGSYQYAVYYKKTSDSTWTAVQSTYASTITKTVTPKAIANYTIRVKAKDSAGTITNKDFAVKVTPALANNSTISSTTVKAGSSLTITCDADNGTAPYFYNIERLKLGGSWTTVKSYANVSSVKVTFPTAGTYSVRVTVQDMEGRSSIKYFSVTAS